MSRPLRSVIDTPRCPNTRPAPALMTMAMPAITAKAAKRLPLTPHCGRRKPGSVSSPPDRKSTRLNSKSRQYLVCRLLLEKKKKDFGLYGRALLGAPDFMELMQTAE